MARKQIKPRTTNVKTTANLCTEALISASDLAQDTGGMIQFLDDVLTPDRDRLELSHNSLDGLSAFLRIIDANLLGIVREIDPRNQPTNSVSVA